MPESRRMSNHAGYCNPLPTRKVSGVDQASIFLFCLCLACVECRDHRGCFEAGLSRGTSGLRVGLDDEPCARERVMSNAVQ